MAFNYNAPGTIMKEASIPTSANMLMMVGKTNYL